MSGRFKTDLVSRKHRYALETDTVTGERYFSIPVSNRLVDYEEQYRIDESEFTALLSDPAAALAFAKRCGARQMDDRLRLQPGSDRGVWA